MGVSTLEEPIVYASPAGGSIVFDGKLVETWPLRFIINQVVAGQTIQLTPGRYTQAVVAAMSGMPDKPITIRGTPGAILDGSQPPTATSKRNVMAPTEEDFAFFTLLSCEWLVLEALAFERCWPSVIFMRGCRNIAVRRCHAEGGQFFLYARNRRGAAPSRGITLDGVTWIQDPGRLMWSGAVTWKEVKGRGPRDFTHFNGALFGSYNIHGDVLIENCTVTHAFNGVRMDCDDAHAEARSSNRDVQVRNNRFTFIRDNAVEPERFARNWWIHGNVMHNVHVPFSFEDTAGGYVYIFANSLSFDSQPADQGNRDGAVYKLGFKRSFEEPFYVFHNSMFIRGVYAKEGSAGDLTHINNAIQFCFDGPYCNPRRGFFKDDTLTLEWDRRYRFDNDISNHPDYPDRFPPPFALAGIASRDIFGGKLEDILVLSAASPGRGAAKPVALCYVQGPDDPPAPAPDIGAWQGNGLYRGPKYRPSP